MLKGKPLSLGDTIGIVNISTKMDSERTDRIVEKIQSMGFKVKLGATCKADFGYLSGNDELRALDINHMFKDNEVDAIICLRGGYGALRVLERIDYELIKKHPKIFMGYSDVTSAHIALNQLSDLVTFHGPMFLGEFERGLGDETFHYLKACLTGESHIEYKNPDSEEILCLVNGEVTAPIIGGNLSLITASLGTPYEIDCKGKILFIEEVNEPPYSIDRMLTQLKLANKFNDCVGVVFGDFADCDNDESEFNVLDLINQIVVPFKKPTIFNLQAGHCTPNYCIPFGVKAHLSAKDKKLIILEASTN